MLIETQSPFEYVITHLQALGWPTLIVGMIYVMRFFTNAETRLQDASLKFNEMHKAVTNHLVHDMDEALQLLRKQDARFETWMVTQAAVAKQAQVHHGD